MTADSGSYHSAEIANHHVRQDAPTQDRKDWPGKQKFYNDGKFFMQCTWAGAFRTVLLILALEGLFLGLVARRLNTPWHIIAMSTSGLLALMTCAFLLQTLFTDPGMLPKLEPSEDYLRLQLPRHRYVPMGDRHVTIRYDDTYHIYRPPRAHHCRVLNVVIARFDHFCPWTGTAIGLRNYRPFVLFLLSCTLSTIHGIAFSVLHIIHHIRKNGAESEPDPGGVLGPAEAEAPTGAEKKSSMASLPEILPTPIMLITLVAFLIAVGALLCFHLYLIARGMTTYESVEGAGAIYSEGVLKNCWNVWFAPTPAPFVDFSQPTLKASERQLPELVAVHNPQHNSRNAGTAGQPIPAHLQQQQSHLAGEENC